jgi:hypothetical protein
MREGQSEILQKKIYIFILCTPFLRETTQCLDATFRLKSVLPMRDYFPSRHFPIRSNNVICFRDTAMNLGYVTVCKNIFSRTKSMTILF